MTADLRAPRLRLVEPAGLPDALLATLAGGPPIAVLPAPGADRERALATLRPDRPVPEPDAAAVVLTSGSQGAPKAVVLTRRNLRSAVAAAHRRLGGPGDWVLALPAHYVAGLMVVARAGLAGSRLTVTSPDLAGLPAAVRDEPAAGRRYLSLVPTQLHRALDRPDLTAALRRFDSVLLGGSAPPGPLLERARGAGIAVVTTYGMSETAGGCVYDGVPLDEVRVLLDDEERISLSGPVVFAGYRLAPELTAVVLDGDTVRTGDRGRWVDDRLRVLGRVDQVVVTGGLNVDLAAVETLAAGWDRSAETVVLALPDPEWGATIMAVTTSLRPLPELEAALADRLPRHAVPRRFERVTALPHTAAGKVDRPAVQRMLEGAA